MSNDRFDQPTDEELAEMHAVKVGDTVEYDSTPDAKGFRTRTVAVVEQIVGFPDSGDLLVVRVKSIFAFHPINVEGGRFLPIPTPWIFQGKKYDPAIQVRCTTR